METIATIINSPANWAARESASSSRGIHFTLSILLIVIGCLLLLIYPVLRHWFILPVTLSGVLITMDVARWLAGRLDAFDPRAIIGIIGVNFFWLSALLIPINEYQPYPLAGVKQLDFRPWLGVMGVFNCVGIFLYQWICSKVANRDFRKPIRVRSISPGLFPVICVSAIVLGAASQIYLMARFGFIAIGQYGEDADFLQGQGIPVLLRSSMPISTMMLFTYLHLKYKNRKRSLTYVLILLLTLTAVGFILNGLTGNRGSTVFTAFWIAGIIHFYYRPFRRREIIAIGLVSLLFMFTYLFYKHYGLYGLKTFFAQGSEAASAEDGTQRSFSGMLVGDLSRSNIHAYAAFVLIEEPYPYELRWGSTLVGDFLSPMPRWLILTKYNLYAYAGKHEAGTDLIRGPGRFDPLIINGKEPRMWGVVGNMMLNFGIYGILPGFALLGLFTGWAQRSTAIWKRSGDFRLVLVPMLTIFALMMLAMDPYVFNLYFLRYFAIPIGIVWLGTQKSGYISMAPSQPS